MRKEGQLFLANAHRPVPEMKNWEWNRDNVDFSFEPSYDTELHEPYDPNLMPFWKEPAESLHDPTVSETWIRKPSRAGGSENVILNDIRFNVARSPMPLLYMSSDQLSTEEFLEERIKLSLKCSDETRAKLAKARIKEHVIYFGDMTLRVAWPKSKRAYKQHGYKTIYVDECSLLPTTSAGQIRKRADTYGFSHLCFISSPDVNQKRPSKDDPIFYETDQTDERMWFMIDPKHRRKRFRFEMGTKETTYGLKWPAQAKRKDGSWDLRMVRRSAYYVTPSGTKIKNSDRLKVVDSGKWIPTNPDAPPNKRGYILNAFLLPFKSGDFGQIACAFLEAKQNGWQHLRTFIYEYLAEPWTETKEATDEDALYERCREYPRGGLISECRQEPSPGVTFFDIYLPKKKLVFGTIDVQKAHQWALWREWIEGGDSGLIDQDYFVTWEDIEKKADEYKTFRMGVDYGYDERAIEVFEYAQRFRAIPLLGRDNLSMYLHERIINPREGKRGAKGQGGGDTANKIQTFEFNTNMFGTLLLTMMRGESAKSWFLYKGVDARYVKQASAMERVEGKWGNKRGHPDEHLWDCEIMQLVLAARYRVYRHDWFAEK